MPLADVLAFLNFAFAQASAAGFPGSIDDGVLAWRTQVAVPGGIADVVLFVDGKPRLVIENKTWSGFRNHSSDVEEANQLHTYCRWLADKCTNSESCGILLITGTTSAPPEFNNDSSYAVASRAQITWAAVGRWLNTSASKADCESATWPVLARELVQFIKEKNLSRDVFSAADVSAAHLMMPTMDRWIDTFDTIWQGGESISGNFLKPRVSDLLFKAEAGMLWHWRYSKRPPISAKTWVALGLRFPDQSAWYEGLALPLQPHFVFIIGSDEGEVECDVALPQDWIRDNEDGHFLLARSVESFGQRPDERVEELQTWGKSALGGAETILRNCRIT